MDKFNCLCKHCYHSTKCHGRYFDVCFTCKDNHKSGSHKFEKLDNLKFLEFVYEQGEKR